LKNKSLSICFGYWQKSCIFAKKLKGYEKVDGFGGVVDDIATAYGSC
jgi:hypothetical protein